MRNMRGASTVLKDGPGAYHKVHDAFAGLPFISTSEPTFVSWLQWICSRQVYGEEEVFYR